MPPGKPGRRQHRHGDQDWRPSRKSGVSKRRERTTVTVPDIGNGTALEERGTAGNAALSHVARPTGAGDPSRDGCRGGLSVDSVIPNRTATALVKPGPAVADAGMSGISELIFAEHARILRLFGALEGVVRRGEPTVPRLALDQIWARLASLLEVHCRAEEEVCFPLMFGGDAPALSFVEKATADHDDLREAVAEARLLDVGSSLWWQVISATRASCTQHFASEERGPLARVCCSVPLETSKVLVRQWTAFAAAQAGGSR